MKALALVAALAFAGCAAPRDPPRDGLRPESEVATPHEVRVSLDGRAYVELRDTPGPLVDGNAPPPPPGVKIPPHPFLSGSCSGGRPDVCSRVRRAIDASSSFREVLTRLRDDGFVVEPLR